MEYQWGTKKSVDKEIVKKDFVNASSLINKAKKTARETDFYLKKLNEKVLPRCQSADISSDITKRNVDVPLKITRRRQNSFKEQLDNNIKTNNDKSKPILKPKSTFQEKHVHFDNSSENVQKNNNSQQFINSSKLPELMKDYKNNVGIVNLKANVPEEKENNDYKVKKLTVQRIPRVDLKPDLVTQKLSNIQIKPVNKKNLCNYKPNVGYHEFAFELEAEICKCQSFIKPIITNDKTAARYEIRKILCSMLDDVSSNNLLSDHLISHLQKVMTKLEKTKLLENNVPNEVDDLIEEHSMVGLSEIVIKKRLLEIAENVIESDNDGNSFDQMSEEIENNSRHVLKRLTKIKNSILAMNPSMEFRGTISEDNQFDNTTAKHVDKNPTNLQANDNIYSKKFPDTTSNNYVSVKEFLCQGSNNFASSKMFKNTSTIKESGSQITLYDNDHIIQNQKTFCSTDVLNNTNTTAQPKKYQLESKYKNPSEITFLEGFVSSKPLSNNSSLPLNTPVKPFEEEYQNNNKKIHYTTHEDDNSSKINAEINTVNYKNNNEISLMKHNQLNKCEDNESPSNINTNIEHVSINNQIQNYGNCQHNIQEWILNSLSYTLLPPNNNEHNNLRVQLLDKETDISSSTTSLMIPLKQSNQVESSAESSISFGEVDHNFGLYNVDSNSSVGEIKN